MPRLPPPTRTDIAVVTRMAKFITISLLAYAAAFLFFAPVRAPRSYSNDQCLRDMILAATNPTSRQAPLLYLIQRIDVIITLGLTKFSCTKEEGSANPEQLPQERIDLVRFFHRHVFYDLKRLVIKLTGYIEYSLDTTRPTLYEAQAIICFQINWHYHQERTYRQAVLARGSCRLQELLVRNAISQARNVNDLVPGTSNPAGGGPALVLSLFSETQGALPAPPSSSPALPVYSGTRHDGPDFGYGAIDAHTYASDPQGALPDPSSSSPALPVYSGTRHDGPDSGYGAIDAPTYASDLQGALPDPSFLDHWRDNIARDDGSDFGYAPSYQTGSTSPLLFDIYTYQDFLQYQTEFRRHAHDQVGPSGGSTSYSDSRNKQHNAGYDIDD
ncbi:hypothetical protein SeMB42_g04712 [Synchytrium endobioticum]|uniref:Uncharacterized protein n=1 Tax=Synchytrium endobioticum TaxID=286115 RepID=A0A507CWC4_9FUNG|nr:hypothetical protein SeMB42_g04712 [Synchytrium endobioticum]